MYKYSLLITLLSAVSVSAIAADNGHGKVNFTGEIVDSPCSISPETIDQTVDLGQISNTALANGGASPSQSFSIELQNCTFEDDWAGKNKISMTFSGGESFDGLLGVTGFAGDQASKGSNVGIRINDPSNTKVVFGTPLEINSTLQDGNNTLLFSAFLQGASVAATDIPLGTFNAVTNFTITYN